MEIAYRPLLDALEKDALSGDRMAAIAFGIIALAAEHRELQRNLTFGDWKNGSSRVQGVFERLAMNTADIAEAVVHVSDAIKSMQDD